MAGALPFLQFFTKDYIADTRVLSLEVRGLWVDMLCLMHGSVRRGYLLSPTGLPLPIEHLATFAGCSVDEAARGQEKLLTSGVCACTTENIIYSRRMVRDEEKRKRCSENGRLGGNPALTKGVKHGVKPQVKPRLIQAYDSRNGSDSGKEEGGAGEGENYAAKTADEFDLTPAGLAQQFAFHYRGSAGFKNVHKVEPELAEAIRSRGVKPADLLAEILRPDRVRSEPPWELVNRLAPKKGTTNARRENKRYTGP